MSADERFYAAQQEGTRVVMKRPLDLGRPRSMGTGTVMGGEAVGQTCDVCGRVILAGQEAFVTRYSDDTRKYVHADCPMRQFAQEYGPKS